MPAGATRKEIEIILRATGLTDAAEIQKALDAIERSMKGVSSAAPAMTSAVAGVGTAAKAAAVDIYGWADSYEVMASASNDAFQAAHRQTPSDSWVKKQQRDLDQLLDEMHQYEQVADRATVGTTKLDVGLGGIGKAGKGASAEMTKLTYLLDDMQYVGEQGLRPILNNLMMISPQLFIVALAAEQLYRNWGRIVGDMGEGDKVMLRASETLGAIEAKIKYLEGKSHKVEVDFTNLDREKEKLTEMQRRLDAFTAAKNALTTTQEKIGKGVTEAMVEHGGAEAVAKSVADVRRRQKTFFDPTDVAEETKVSKELLAWQLDHPLQKNRHLEDKLAALQAKMEAAGQKKVEDFIASAQRGDEGARQQLEDLARGHRGDFTARGVDEGFIPDLMRSSRKQIQDRAAQENRTAIERNEREQQAALIDRENEREQQSIAEGARLGAEADAKKKQITDHARGEADRVDKSLAAEQAKRQAEVAKLTALVAPVALPFIASVNDALVGKNRKQQAAINLEANDRLQRGVTQGLMAQGVDAGHAATMAPDVSRHLKSEFGQRLMDAKAQGLNSDQARAQILGGLQSAVGGPARQTLELQHAMLNGLSTFAAQQQRIGQQQAWLQQQLGGIMARNNAGRFQRPPLIGVFGPR